MTFGHGRWTALCARLGAFWANTQRATLLIAAADQQWTLVGRRLVMRNLWSLPAIKREGPLTGSDPRSLLREMGVSRPDYVVPSQQMVRHLAYPPTIKARDLPALLHLEGSRHTPFASERLVMSYRQRRPTGAADAPRQTISVSYCLREELEHLREALGPCGPRWGFLAALDAKGEELLDDAWWRAWTPGFGFFIDEKSRLGAPKLRPFLVQAALVPLAAALLVGPSLALWQARVTARLQELRTLYDQGTIPLRATRAAIHRSRRLHAELMTLYRYGHHAGIWQSLLPQLAQALPASATLTELRYDARTHDLRLQIKTRGTHGLLQALAHATGASWQQSGMAQPVRPGVRLVTLGAHWPAVAHP